MFNDYSLIYFRRANPLLSWVWLSLLLLMSGNVLAANVGLAWTASTASKVGGYLISYGQGSRNYTATVDVGASTKYTLTGLQAGVTYYFAISAYDSTRKLVSRFSNETSVTTPTGVVAAYGFDETPGGGAVPDYSGHHNNGILTGAAKVVNAGRFGNALKFSGTSNTPNWVTVGNTASLALSTGMTLEAWVYPTAWMSGAQTVIMKEGATAEAYLLGANNSTNQPMSAVWTGGEVAVGGNGQIPPNQWTHLATTYDGQYQSLYVNGVLVNMMPQTGVPATSTGALRIGGNALWGNFFQGYIDEVRVYNRALTNTQIISDSTTPVSVSNPPTFVFGDQNIESTVQTIPLGEAMAFQFAAPQNTKMATGIQVYLDPSSTATRLEVGVYTNGKTGHPSTMLTGAWTTSSLKVGWNTIPVPAQSFSAGQTYWMGIIGFGGKLQLRVQPGAATNVVETSASIALAGLPYTWVTGSVSTSGPVSAYVSGY